MIGIPHCNSPTKTPADRYLPFASRPILSATSWVVPVWESHSTENLRSRLFSSPARHPWRITTRTTKTWHPISILPRISRKQKFIWRRKIISNCSKWGISSIRLVLRAEIGWSSAERMEMTSDYSRSLSETREVFFSVNIQQEICSLWG